MTPRELKLTLKNAKHWKARVNKLQKKGADRTEDEDQELEMRNAQLTIWSYQLKHAQPGGTDPAGSMSASSKVKSSEKAGASA